MIAGRNLPVRGLFAAALVALAASPATGQEIVALRMSGELSKIIARMRLE